MCHPPPSLVPPVEAVPCLYLETIKVVLSAFGLMFERKVEGTEEGVVPRDVLQGWSPRGGPPGMVPRGGPQGWSPRVVPRDGPQG